jgi:hypothetical protein
MVLHFVESILRYCSKCIQFAEVNDPLSCRKIKREIEHYRVVAKGREGEVLREKISPQLQSHWARLLFLE